MVTMSNILLNLGKKAEQSSNILIPPEQIFGCHCAILGGAGSGKSWTLTRLLEESAKFQAKIILLDVTGEHANLDPRTFHVHIQSEERLDSTINRNSHPVTAPYFEITEPDLCSLFDPKTPVQLFKLQSAIRTLKLLQCEPELSENGVFQKATRIKTHYDELIRLHEKTIGRPDSIFNVYNLAQQVGYECVEPCTAGPESHSWGELNSNEHRECAPLIQGIQELLNQPALRAIFNPPPTPSVFEALEKFITDENISILRISLTQLPSTHRIRPIIAGAIARALLSLARNGALLNSPVVLALDESHQLVSQNSMYPQIQKENYPVFEALAKEGRKMGLTLCVACQSPSEIPQTILTQCSFLIVHILTGKSDQEIVARSIGSLNEGTLKKLSTLPQGTALISHENHSLIMRVHKPNTPPLSQGPDYQKMWQRPSTDGE